jgi:hypothetical protein
MWIILILFCINSCSYQQQSGIETIENSYIYRVDSLKEDTSEILREKIEFSISHLNKIIERNESRIKQWELDLMSADSSDSIDLQIDIKQMKNRVVIQKERLRRLKSKDD